MLGPHDSPAARPASRRRVPLWWCAPLALALSVSACTAETDAASRALPDGVAVELRQLRSDVAARTAQVLVTNDTDSTLTVGDLFVEDPRFDGAAERITHRDSLIAAGTSVAIPVQLPAVVCPAADDATATVTFEWSIGESSGAATAPLTDPLSFVAPLHDRECRADALGSALKLTMSSFTPSPSGEPADLVLTVTPTGEAAGAIVAVHPTNLLAWADAPVEPYPLDFAVMPGDTSATDLHLPLVPLRCDPHAVQEDKRGTVFTVDVEVDGEPGQIELAASEDMRGRILTWVGDWCGFGS